MKGFLTSYAGMFEAHAPGIGSIEIPLIQRDYAQGRPSTWVGEIRADFLEVLLDAVAGGEPVGLDFVYGKIEGTTFHPLDGQQRLTTLFLLHWYLASAAGELRPEAAWTRFSYATRASARLFCERLALNPLPQDEAVPSVWIIDQAWYLHVWRNDPTIQAMLVMIDAIHRDIGRLHPDLDAHAAWQRLTHAESPAVSFYLLPLDDMESDEDLYIKMNSRGKPLTPFETFKARFEQDIRHSDRADEFAHKIDGSWSDLLWPYHGGDNIVDDELVHYIRFITELCELRENRPASEDRLVRRARAVFGRENKRADEHLNFLFGAFDSWRDGEHIEETFDKVLSTALPGQPRYDSRKVLLFGASGVNLFEQCLRRGVFHRPFTLQQTLFLYAVLLHVIEGTEEFPRRLRVLRNLIAASEDEMRRSSMPALIADVEEVIVHGDLGAVTGFSGNQVEDERRKQKFLNACPEFEDALFRLEDHPILRGTLSAFELDSDSFRHRAEAFETAFGKPLYWRDLTGALLATGNYQRRRPKSSAWQFGTGSTGQEWVWRYLLAETTFDALATTRAVLGEFLDGLAASGSGAAEYFGTVTGEWLAERETAEVFDWRYYLVKYSSMREGATGIYYGVDGELGYSLCMLRTKQRNGNYRDPILLEVWKSSGAGDRVADPWFTGYETNPRWLRLERSSVGMRSVSDGFELQAPEDEALRAKFDDICRRHDVEEAGDRLVVKAPQRDHGDGPVDSADRVVLGAAFLRDLVAAGL
ncbi:DUF262 domain-containing protein [Amycolatopsis alba]|uniref:DUF262 domain-containing protein n=1 Tax=Amycolatopsis alba DSM 44262 TaxID=1125972 RepID=A0A229RES7_AMYAL|nr:DUF262 domain-containing protein [Amycolatopsis alba]OXM45173.1 DUF262 domain-containing protein [Amycolatopsis alba DSM 44262]